MLFEKFQKQSQALFAMKLEFFKLHEFKDQNKQKLKTISKQFLLATKPLDHRYDLINTHRIPFVSAHCLGMQQYRSQAQEYFIMKTNVHKNEFEVYENKHKILKLEQQKVYKDVLDRRQSRGIFYFRGKVLINGEQELRKADEIMDKVFSSCMIEIEQIEDEYQLNKKSYENECNKFKQDLFLIQNILEIKQEQSLLSYQTQYNEVVANFKMRDRTIVNLIMVNQQKFRSKMKSMIKIIKEQQKHLKLLNKLLTVILSPSK